MLFAESARFGGVVRATWVPAARFAKLINLIGDELDPSRNLIPVSWNGQECRNSKIMLDVPSLYPLEKKSASIGLI
jgi:hypothetical protein